MRGNGFVLALVGLCCCMLSVKTAIPSSAASPGLTMVIDVQPRTPAAIRAGLLYGGRTTPASVDAAGEVLLLQPRSDDDEEPRRVDPWFSFDKVQHFTFSFLFTLGWQYSLENKLDWSREDALPVSIGSSLLIGLSKELYDWQMGPRRFFSYRDMVANSVGVGMAAVFILL